MISFLSGETILQFRPNGGTAVFLRTCFVSTLVYLLAIVLKARLAPGAISQFDPAVARALVSDTIPWFGAIFAGVYVALYSRFASQWNYLASLYNQLMATAVQCPPDGTNSTKILRTWQAGFIEDAEDLHLAGKPLFASIIRSLLAKDEVRQAFLDHTPGGLVRLALLEQKVALVTDKTAQLRSNPRVRPKLLTAVVLCLALIGLYTCIQWAIQA
jgi:hypothetical protein